MMSSQNHTTKRKTVTTSARKFQKLKPSAVGIGILLYLHSMALIAEKSLSGSRPDEPFSLRRKQPQDTRDQEQTRNIAHEMAMLSTVGKRLHPHDCGMHDA